MRIIGEITSLTKLKIEMLEDWEFQYMGLES